MDEFQQQSVGREAAIKMAESRWWVGKPAREVFLTQMAIAELCMDFSDFQAAAEVALGRPVWTHEFARPQNLLNELAANDRNGRATVINPLTHTLEVLQGIMGNDKQSIVVVSE